MANMNGMNRNSKKINLAWGDGKTELFLAPSKSGLEVLDYEFDFDRIHKMCGGKVYYRSRSGCSGAGYIEKFRELTRVGYYRVDTVHNEFQYPVELTEEVKIMLPYASHICDKGEILSNYPVVIMIGQDTIVYCGFFSNMKEVLATLLSGEKLEQTQTPKILKRTFVNTKSKSSEEVELKFYNLFGKSFYPWEFAKELLKDYSVSFSAEYIHKIFRICICEDGSMVRTTRIGQTLYASEVLKSDPCENLTKPISGWEFAQTNMLYKVRENEVYIVGWELAADAYQKRVERIARFIPASEADEFKNFVMEYLPSKYVEFELTVPKLLFFLNKEKQFAKIRKGIANKVREDVLFEARHFIDKFNDKRILEAIPDDLVITFEDSLNSGNCKPGTQAFVDQYFPGKTETTAGELKKYAAGNWNVMRVLRFIATRDMIAGKEVKLVLPA